MMMLVENSCVAYFKSILLFYTLQIVQCADETLCSKCGLFVSTFLEGMSKTERGGFAGGNTQWEQKTLKNYKSSEVRYAEITDFVCKSSDKINLNSDEEHQCQQFLEDNEDLVEGWYFHKQGQYPDLKSYLCVDNKKVCCHKDTCGPKCEPCPDSSSGVCSNRGRFKETKLGNKECHCDKGYKGDYCNSCADNYFETSRNDTHLFCQRCHKSCNGCSGPSKVDCVACKQGWHLSDIDGCQDIDECALQIPICKGEHQMCVNTQGSFKCKCKENFVQRDDGTCVPDANGGKSNASATTPKYFGPTIDRMNRQEEESDDIEEDEEETKKNDDAESEEIFQRLLKNNKWVLDHINAQNPPKKRDEM